MAGHRGRIGAAWRPPQVGHCCASTKLFFGDVVVWCWHRCRQKFIVIWSVVYLPLWKIRKSVGAITPNIWKNKKCSKPPTSHSLWALHRGSPRCTPGDAGVDRGPTACVCRTTQFKQILMVFPIKILIWKIYSFSDTQRFSGFLQIFHQMAISRKQIFFHFHRPIRCIPCLLQLLIIVQKTPTKKCNHHPSSWWFYNSNFTMDYGTYTIVYL